MMTGGCACGALRWRAEAEPLMQGFCHCRNCQRLSGSGHIGFLSFPASAVTIEGATRTFVRPGGSGRTATRYFCAVCLSGVLGKTETMPDRINVYAGSLDDPTLFKPAFAIFTRSRPSWDDVSRGLVCYETLPSG